MLCRTCKPIILTVSCHSARLSSCGRAVCLPVLVLYDAHVSWFALGWTCVLWFKLKHAAYSMPWYVSHAHAVHAVYTTQERTKSQIHKGITRLFFPSSLFTEGHKGLNFFRAAWWTVTEQTAGVRAGGRVCGRAHSRRAMLRIPVRTPDPTPRRTTATYIYIYICIHILYIVLCVLYTCHVASRLHAPRRTTSRRSPEAPKPRRPRPWLYVYVCIYIYIYISRFGSRLRRAGRPHPSFGMRTLERRS